MIAVAELSFGHSLRKDLADKGVRIQTVLPGATATEFWDISGYRTQKTAEITMSEADRRNLAPKFANAKPAPRYAVASHAADAA